VAEELSQGFGLTVNLIPEREGIFDILLDGDLIYSKSESGRFPEPGEIAAMFQQ
jgi:selT/selW/selH-like putative selenoprotein|tara:strand:- start:334 stop:495 length:162 start_codon:yes stop_codon:yes gene_type:complete